VIVTNTSADAIDKTRTTIAWLPGDRRRVGRDIPRPRPRAAGALTPSIMGDYTRQNVPVA
jgi:hypothetical protein